MKLQTRCSLIQYREPEKAGDLAPLDCCAFARLNFLFVLFVVVKTDSKQTLYHGGGGGGGGILVFNLPR